jgi:hypothetical protein
MGQNGPARISCTHSESEQCKVQQGELSPETSLRILRFPAYDSVDMSLHVAPSGEWISTGIKRWALV